jgi:hypothetical protein
MLTKKEQQLVNLARQWNLGLISYDELLMEMSLAISIDDRTHEQIIEEDL